MGMGDFRIAGGLLPRMHSVPGPSRLPSALSRNAVLHTGPHLFPPLFQRLHPHSFIPHPCSSPSPPSTSCPVSFTSHYPHPAAGTLLLARRLVTPFCPFPSLSPDQNFPSVSHFLGASSLNPCLHTQPLYICVFTVSNLSPLTTFISLGPTPSSFLPVSQWHGSDSFSHASKSLLLPPASQHKVCPGHCQPLLTSDTSFFCPFLTLPMLLATPLTFLHHYPVPISSCPERFLPRNLLWIAYQKAQLSSRRP